MTMAELVVSNIRYLAKANKIKLGEIEKQCGVSVGYFSRKVSMDGASIPIHVAKQAAEILDVSLDELCTNFRYDRLKQEAEELGFRLVPIEPCVEEGEPDDIASTVFK
jgi:transcriptional regulator with XRE-family HTH domain